jgi:PAS domain S-box-containing protein
VNDKSTIREKNAQAPPAAEQLAVFTQTFASFNSTLKTLNESYASLRARYQQIADELSDTNEKLRNALTEKERTRSYLERVLESLTAGVITIDLQGRVASANQAACRILRADHRELVGGEYDKLYAGGFARTRPLTALLEGADVFRVCEKRLQLDEHTTVPISASGALIRGVEGSIEGALEVFTDLTELKQMEEEIARVKSLAALGEVAALIAHEVRNPLSGIGGFAALLESELGEDHPQINYVRKIVGGVEKLEQTVLSLLEYARDLKLDSDTGDLRGLVKETVDSFQIELSARGSRNQVSLALPDRRLECRFDRQHLCRALTNLLRNADQAAPDGSEIAVNLAADAEAATITVSDNGEQIPEQLREKIFTPFFTTRQGGTGLGLALVKKIVDAHHGSVELTTPEADSKSFVIRLPVS